MKFCEEPGDWIGDDRGGTRRPTAPSPRLHGSLIPNYLTILLYWPPTDSRPPPPPSRRSSPSARWSLQTAVESPCTQVADAGLVQISPQQRVSPNVEVIVTCLHSELLRNGERTGCIAAHRMPGTAVEVGISTSASSPSLRVSVPAIASQFRTPLDATCLDQSRRQSNVIPARKCCQSWDSRLEITIHLAPALQQIYLGCCRPHLLAPTLYCDQQCTRHACLEPLHPDNSCNDLLEGHLPTRESDKRRGQLTVQPECGKMEARPQKTGPGHRHQTVAADSSFSPMADPAR